MQEKYDVIIGFNWSRSGEDNYFYIAEGTDAGIIIQAAVDYLHALKPDATFPNDTLGEIKNG